MGMEGSKRGAGPGRKGIYRRRGRGPKERVYGHNRRVDLAGPAELVWDSEQGSEVRGVWDFGRAHLGST